MTDDYGLPLGRPTDYTDTYDAALLCPFPRQAKRDEIGVDSAALPFAGEDIWNGYELSWLQPDGRPVVATAVFRFPCSSPFLIESKSFKLYLNSFNQTVVADVGTLAATLQRDLADACGAPVAVEVQPLPGMPVRFAELPGECIDGFDVAIDRYSLDASLLAGAASGEVVEETLHSHLLKSNCLVTRQPDWASVMIRYRGRRLDRQALLRYLISFRQHSEFHEQCVERIFTDLKRFCAPERLTVYARYTRRGGLDINPMRSDFEESLPNWRLVRQ